MSTQTIDTTKRGLQRLSCGCTAEVRYGSPLFDMLCPEASDLFTTLIRSPQRNAVECAERDAIRAHIGMAV